MDCWYCGALDMAGGGDVCNECGRTPIEYDDVSVPPPPPSAADWNDDGVVILRGAMPENHMIDYATEWMESHGATWPPRNPGGWPNPTPYFQHRALREMMTYAPLMNTIQSLIDEPPGLHLCLTGWVSTRRDWHQDTYLNPPHVGDSYAAVWVALEDIHPDSGPFQYVPGSHRWPTVTQEKISRYVDMSDPRWPAHTEKILTPIFEKQIAVQTGTTLVAIPGGYNDYEWKQRRAQVVTYLPKRGDVLIWHGRLVHRGSPPIDPKMHRRAVIAHYSGIHHRPDMPRPVQDVRSGGWYFPIDTSTSNTSGQVSPEAQEMV